MYLSHVNWLHVLVAAVAAFALGGLWYSPVLFAKQWVAAHGFSEAQVADMQKGAGKAYAITFVCWFAMALALAILLWRAGIYTMGGTLRLALLCWGGLILPVGVSQAVFGGRKPALLLIDGGYQLASLLVMGVVFAVWN